MTLSAPTNTLLALTSYDQLITEDADDGCGSAGTMTRTPTGAHPELVAKSGDEGSGFNPGAEQELKTGSQRC
jgi:hypothetical protein